MLTLAALAHEAMIVVLGGSWVVEAELGVLWMFSANGSLRQSTFPLAGTPHNCHMQLIISKCIDYCITSSTNMSFQIHVTLTFDLLTSRSKHAKRLPMPYPQTKFGVDSSIRFPFRVQTHTQTHTHSHIGHWSPSCMHQLLLAWDNYQYSSSQVHNN